MGPLWGQDQSWNGGIGSVRRSLALPCLVLSCLILSCLVSSCMFLSMLVLSDLGLSCVMLSLSYTRYKVVYYPVFRYTVSFFLAANVSPLSSSCYTISYILIRRVTLFPRNISQVCSHLYIQSMVPSCLILIASFYPL